MRRLVVTVLSAGLLFSGTLPSFGGVGADQQTQTTATATTATDPVQSADANFRATLASAMSNAASQRGLSIDTSNMVYVTRGDGIAANAPISGIENISETQLANGADVAFAYFSLQSSANVPVGFYVVRMFLTPGAASGTGQLIDANGNVAGTFAIQNNVNEAPLIRLVFTLIIGPNFVCVDFHFRVGRFWIAAILCIYWVVQAAPAQPATTGQAAPVPPVPPVQVRTDADVVGRKSGPLTGIDSARGRR